MEKGERWKKKVKRNRKGNGNIGVIKEKKREKISNKYKR